MELGLSTKKLGDTAGGFVENLVFSSFGLFVKASA